MPTRRSARPARPAPTAPRAPGDDALASLLVQTGRSTHDTPDRLLRVALRVFAARGYRQATIREICRLAKANVAAVKYHFHDKLGLYHAAIARAHHEALRGGAALQNLLHPEPDRSPEDALRRWVHGVCVLVVRKDQRHAEMTSILLHEMRDPTPALDAIIRDLAMPMRDQLELRVRALASPQAPRADIEAAINFVMCVCMQYDHSTELFARFGHPRPRTPADVAAYARRVGEFAVGGVRALVGGAP